MQFLCLIYVDPGRKPPADSVARYGALNQAMKTQGVFIAAGQLQPTDESAVLRIEPASTNIADGPVAAGTTAPAAFYLIECTDREPRLPGLAESRPLNTGQSKYDRSATSPALPRRDSRLAEPEHPHLHHPEHRIHLDSPRSPSCRQPNRSAHRPYT